MTMRTDDEWAEARSPRRRRLGPFATASIGFVVLFFAVVGGWLAWDAANTRVTTTPDVTAAIEIDVTFVPEQAPLTVTHVVVRNVSAVPIDISGWTLATPGWESRALELTEGTVLLPGAALAVHQIRVDDCPPSTGAAIWICYGVVGPIDAPTFPDPSIDLADRAGEVVASFRP